MTRPPIWPAGIARRLSASGQNPLSWNVLPSIGTDRFSWIWCDYVARFVTASMLILPHFAYGYVSLWMAQSRNMVAGVPLEAKTRIGDSARSIRSIRYI